MGSLGSCKSSSTSHSQRKAPRMLRALFDTWWVIGSPTVGTIHRVKGTRGTSSCSGVMGQLASASPCARRLRSVMLMGCFLINWFLRYGHIRNRKISWRMCPSISPWEKSRLFFLKLLVEVIWDQIHHGFLDLTNGTDCWLKNEVCYLTTLLIGILWSSPFLDS